MQNDDDTGLLDAKDEGILDLLISKQWAIKLATEAARTVLSVDQIIVARQAGGPKPPGPNPVCFPSSCCKRSYLTDDHRTGMRTKWIMLCSKRIKWAKSMICEMTIRCHGYRDILADRRVKTCAHVIMRAR